MPAGLKRVCLNDRTTASTRKGGETGKTRTKYNRELCTEDETPWETKGETSEIVGGVCVCMGGAATQDPVGPEVLEMMFAFGI